MKINIILFLVLMLSLSSQARDARSLWKTIPDSVVPSIDNVRRLEMLDLIDYRVKAEVDNRFGSQSLMDTITTDYLHVEVSKSSSLSMRLLPTTTGDTIICLVHTFCGPMAESSIQMFDLCWHQIDSSNYLPFSSIDDVADSLFFRPDTMSQERYLELRKNMVMALASVETSVSNSDLTLSLSLPMIGKEDKRAMASITRKRLLSWSGDKYVWHEE